MSKPLSQPGASAESEVPYTAVPQNRGDASREPGKTALAELVGSHLRAQGIRQIDFCRQTGFDQGLLSKILSSVVTTLNVESALKLADGMNIPPSVVFEAIGKRDLDLLLRRFYSEPRS